MDANRFDALSKLFAARRLSRRRVLAAGGAGLAAGLAAARPPAAAQDATPESPDPGDSHGPEMLFVQSFRSGSIVANEGEEGRFTVTLEDGLGQTIYFSDRPDRIVGTTPTPQFLQGLGFTPDNPPNAALVLENDAGETDIVVAELFNPVYDPAGPTVTYEVVDLADWQESLELGFGAAPADLAAIAATFGAAHLFIDGCPDGEITCQSESGVAGAFPSSVFGGFCFSQSDGVCLPCKPWYDTTSAAFSVWQEACNAEFSKCAGACEPLGVSRIEN